MARHLVVTEATILSLSPDTTRAGAPAVRGKLRQKNGMERPFAAYRLEAIAALASAAAGAVLRLRGSVEKGTFIVVMPLSPPATEGVAA